MPDPALARYLAVAEEAARAAGRHALAHAARRSEVVVRSPHDVKLQLDLEAQAVAEGVLRKAFPEHALLGEEGGEADEGQAMLWIVDPIDGTVNFSHGLTHWCVSVALRQQGDVVAGAVYLPCLDLCYTATSDTVAACNGEPLRVSNVAKLADSVVLTGISRHVQNDKAFERFRSLARGVQKLRVMGSAAADICLVAAGQADGYLETGIHLWDWAAAGLIVRQAGGRAEPLSWGGEQGFLCSNGQIHDALRQVAGLGSTG